MISEKYLSEIIQDEFEDYEYIFCQYSQCDAVYQIQYSYLINGILTDDLISIFIQDNGTVGAFLMPNKGVYRNVKLNEELFANIDQSDESTQYFTKSGNKLVLVRNAVVTNEFNDSEIVQSIFEVGEVCE